MNKTVLVIEDNIVTCEGLGVILRNAGYAAALASHGAAALDYLDNRPAPDLILLDMLMPVMDGWHFLEALQNRPRPPAVPVLVMTGTVISRQWAEDHGCAGFLRKPVEVGPLLEEIQRCLSGAGGTA
jgi:CheY-like chemotaxis protein